MLEGIGNERAIDQLKISEERYRNLVELAPDAIITVDLKGLITSCNSAAIALTGYPKHELIGRHFTETGAILSDDIFKFSSRRFSFSEEGDCLLTSVDEKSETKRLVPSYNRSNFMHA